MDCAVVMNLPARAEGLGSKTLSRNINYQTPSHGVEWQSQSQAHNDVKSLVLPVIR